ncbi:beta-ketoacyl synthase N-terminal-like domain-containing protein [Streptomyces sp. NPDC058545]|uniref:beta-ketoacyl synthase N-terminal-like domain-containing protein n=1 Tax=Streptomyces sp. NPDC058545 TaxID=3346544 RepID=UPI003657A976
MKSETVRTVLRAPARQTAVAAAGLGVRLPGAAGLSGLLVPSALRRFAHEAPEHEHALAAATDAIAAASTRTPGTPGAPGAGGSTATVWASSTAGLAAYAQTCADIPEFGPGRVSPRRTAHSAFTAPVTAVSVRFGLDGPYLNVTGEQDAGAHAVTEAVRMLTRGRCERVVVGGSADTSTWRSCPGGDPAEGALCAVLQRHAPDGGGATVRPVLRARTARNGVDAFVRSCLDRLDGPPDHLVLSAPATDSRAAGALALLCAAPLLRVEERFGDLGAAGGVAAMVTAVALTAAPGPLEQPGPRVLALALGSGNAVAVEVTSRRKGPR